MAATRPGETARKASLAARRQRARQRGQRLSLGEAIVAIVALSLGFWWLIWKAATSLMPALF